MESFNTTNTDTAHHIPCHYNTAPWPQSAVDTQLIKQLQDLSSCSQKLAIEFNPHPAQSISHL